MGYMRHHAIVVTSWNGEAIQRAHAKAEEVFTRGVSSITGPLMNHYSSFLIAPDGSKEGWEDSNTGDDLRKEFRDWLNDQAYDDGSSCLKWVEVQFGDDDLETLVIHDGDERLRKL